MIQPLHMTQLSSAKPRAGLQQVSELLPRLIRLYELQAEAQQQIEQDRRHRAAMKRREGATQTTFGW